MDEEVAASAAGGSGAKAGLPGVRPSVHSARVFEETPHVVTIGDRIRVVVHLLDASSRSILVDADDTVEAVVAAVTQRLSFADPWMTGSYAGLHECMDGITLQRPLRKERKIGEVLQRWPKGSLAPGQEPPKLVFAFAAITEALLKSSDPRVLYFLFIQCVYHVISGIYPCSAEEAIFLGALQLQARFGSHDPTRHKPGYFAASLQGLIPAPLFSGRKPHEWEQDLILRYAHLREEARAAPQRWYLNRLRAKDYFGCSFFTVAQQFSGMLPSTLQIGVSSQGITLFDLDTRSSLERYPLSSLYRWGCRKAGKVFFFQIKDAAGDQGACLEFHTKASAAVADLVAMYAQLSLLEFGFVPWEPDRCAPSKPAAASNAVAGAGPGSGAVGGAGSRKADGDRDRDRERDRRASGAAGPRGSMVGAGLLGGTPGAAEAARGSLAAYRSTAGTGDALLSASRRSLIGGAGGIGGAGAGAGAAPLGAGISPPGAAVSAGLAAGGAGASPPPTRLQVPLSAALAAAAASGADISPALVGGRAPTATAGATGGAASSAGGGGSYLVPPLPLAPLALAPAVGVARPLPPGQSLSLLPSASASASSSSSSSSSSAAAVPIVPASVLSGGGMAVNPLSTAALRANAAAVAPAASPSTAVACGQAAPLQPAASPTLKPSSSPPAGSGASSLSGSARQLLDGGGFASQQQAGAAGQAQLPHFQGDALSPQLSYHQTHATMRGRAESAAAAPWKPSSIAGFPLRRKRAQTTAGASAAGNSNSPGGGSAGGSGEGAGPVASALPLPVEIKGCSTAGRAALRAAVRSVGQEEGRALAAAAAAAAAGSVGGRSSGVVADASHNLRLPVSVPSHGSFFGSAPVAPGAPSSSSLSFPLPPGTPSSRSTSTGTGTVAGSPRSGATTGHTAPFTGSKPPLPSSPRPPATILAAALAAASGAAGTGAASTGSELFRPPLPPGAPPLPAPGAALQPPLPRDPRPAAAALAAGGGAGGAVAASPTATAAVGSELRLASGKIPLLPLGSKPPPPPRKASASAPSTMRGSTADGGEAEPEAAAVANRLSVKLQALARGNRVRQMLHAQYAAIRIQARWRGYSSRSKARLHSEIDGAGGAATGAAGAAGAPVGVAAASAGGGARLPSMSAPLPGGRASEVAVTAPALVSASAPLPHPHPQHQPQQHRDRAGMSAAGSALLAAAAPARASAPSWKPTR